MSNWTQAMADHQNRKVAAFRKAVSSVQQPTGRAGRSKGCPDTLQTPQTALRLVISGQIRGGKNSVQTTQTGHRYPNPKWAEWRDAAVARVKFQLPKDFKPISKPVNMRLTYIAGDKRRRDQPAIIDSIFHVLEKAGVVADDTLIWIVASSRSYDKINPMAIIETMNTPTHEMRHD